jgi:hypothetical protein
MLTRQPLLRTPPHHVAIGPLTPQISLRVFTTRLQPSAAAASRANSPRAATCRRTAAALAASTCRTANSAVPIEAALSAAGKVAPSSGTQLSEPDSNSAPTHVRRQGNDGVAPRTCALFVKFRPRLQLLWAAEGEQLSESVPDSGPGLAKAPSLYPPAGRNLYRGSTPYGIRSTPEDDYCHWQPAGLRRQSSNSLRTKRVYKAKRCASGSSIMCATIGLLRLCRALRLIPSGPRCCRGSPRESERAQAHTSRRPAHRAFPQEAAPLTACPHGPHRRQRRTAPPQRQCQRQRRPPHRRAAGPSRSSGSWASQRPSATLAAPQRAAAHH